jgi:hypothetical protein
MEVLDRYDVGILDSQIKNRFQSSYSGDVVADVYESVNIMDGEWSKPMDKTGPVDANHSRFQATVSMFAKVFTSQTLFGATFNDSTTKNTLGGEIFFYK